MTAAEVIACCRTLATFSEEPGVTTRTFLSAPMHDVHTLLTSLMSGAGLDVRIDAAGNLRGVYAAATTGAPRLLIGSHLDTVRSAGAFDGGLGVVVGLALASRLRGRRLPFAIEVIGFSEEEGVRFGVPFIGSRAVAGTLDDETLARADGHGRTVRDAISDFGLDASAISHARLPSDVIGYVEFHIEQGPVLDKDGVPLAIVTAIAGQTRATVTFTGAANHAGTTPMIMRRDALAGAAEWIVSVEREATAVAGLVATVGQVDVRPNVGNVIAGSCSAFLDIRHADDRQRLNAVERLRAGAHAIGQRRGLRIATDIRLDQAAVPMNCDIISRLERAVARCGYPARLMTSGAGHDAMVLAAHVPVGMLFLRTPGGISHHPDETVREDDVEAALNVGLAFLEDLAETA